MQRERVVVLGGGGHAKVVIDILQAMNCYEIIGFTSFGYTAKEMYGVSYLGGDEIITSLVPDQADSFIVAVGNNILRKKLFDWCLELGLQPINAISPFSYISPYASLGKGIVVAPGVAIHPDSKIQDNVIINTNASVDHDCFIGSHAHIAPGVTLTGNVNVNEGVMLGAKTVVIPGKSIGSWATVGAGAAVITDIQPNCTVVGVPAKNLIEGEC
ncbi:acetyltransferase [Paenibacillus sp. NPDC058177]|uniref:acetyltransferase n=1 Tax=Paenibacillus sp. NPDC058177 TaxID=3346369 RepID=UPI0036DEB526